MNKGFYWPNNMNRIQSESILKGNQCEKCKLHKTCISPKMQYTGGGKKEILVLAECPGSEEDKRNTQLVGQSGQKLRDILREFDIDLHKDCWKDNVVICRTINNKTPTNNEIAFCRSHVFKNIKKLKPKKIIVLGLSAMYSLLGHRTSINSLGKWIGWKIPDQDIGTWIFPIYHPSYLIRNLDQKALILLFKKYLREAIEWDKPFVKEKPEDGIELLNTQDAIDYMRKIIETKSSIAFDYETTGIKPHRPRHSIRCISMSNDINKAVAFSLSDNLEFKKLLKDILTNEKIGKIAQNFKFEDTWTRYILGYQVKGWIWDTMLASHILDNRSGITGLKFQTYVNYGVLGYDDSISKYLKAKGSNDFNKVYESPENLLLKYCAIDSKYTYKLWKDQEKIMDSHLKKGYKLFHNGSLSFSDAESNGILLNTKYYASQNENLSNRINKLYNRIMNSSEVEKWNEINPKRTFRPKSEKHLIELLFDVLKYKKNKTTNKGSASVDFETLKNIGSNFTNTIITYRKLSKIRDTYIKGFLNEAVNGIMHPNFNLNMVVSYRSSSSNPNFQNVPKHDKQAQKIIRNGIIARLGYYLVEADFGKLEVHVSGCYHKDPTMLNYLHNEDTDMHRDESFNLFFLNDDTLTKDLRYITKNNWVFPQFYGSYYAQCAINLWDKVISLKMKNGELVKNHLKKNGINNYNDFEDHTKNCEFKFWKKFKVYKKWREDTWENYQNKGYVELLTGFRCHGLMRKNEVLNLAIQGTAFHCLLWSFIEMNKILKENNYKSHIIGQIHDAMVLEVYENELDEIMIILKRVMTQDIREEWKWINSPLSIEAEYGKDWYNMKEYKFKE